jgi:hypothetical protein
VKGGDEKLQETFKAADKDGSGFIDYSEFKIIYCKLVDPAEELKRRWVGRSHVIHCSGSYLRSSACY